ncbi:hypothetical protein ACVIGB_007592 [Bradyrhizobium sp. USDA 4341]|uniref:Uncharacterized protein n=1 Tax=Bradyrhizobium erythrophlei TaxID=1437360 RepID=A0A1H5ER72_9BRAD|nr:hypothetical protein SAMN05444164_6344 [Bradyrhizobium erythrophlei]
MYQTNAQMSTGRVTLGPSKATKWGENAFVRP